VCHPLLDVDDINARQDAVEDVLANDALCRIFEALVHVPDLERKLSRIRAWAQKTDGAQGVAEGAAALRRAVQELVAALDGFNELERFRQAIFGQLAVLRSPLLRNSIVGLPDMSALLTEILDQFDINEARVSKSIVLLPGCCAEYDRARARKV
jgi:DNA mismatch repair protein MSH6